MLAIGSYFGAPFYPSHGQRPERFHLDPYHQLAQGLQFFGGGAFPGTEQYYDSSIAGEGNRHGTLVSGPTWQWVQELGRRGLDFDANAEHVTLADSSAWNVASSATWCFWINHVVGRTPTNYARFWTRTNREWGFFLHNTNGSLYFEINGGQEILSRANLMQSYDGVWCHICVTRDGSLASNQYKLYVQGQYTAQVTAVVPNDSTNAVKIGQFNANQSSWSTLADVMMSSVAFSLPQIASLADPANFMLSLGSGDAGLIVPDDVVYPVYLPTGVIPAAAKPALWLGCCV